MEKLQKEIKEFQERNHGKLPKEIIFSKEYYYKLCSQAVIQTEYGRVVQGAALEQERPGKVFGIPLRVNSIQQVEDFILRG